MTKTINFIHCDVCDSEVDSDHVQFDNDTERAICDNCVGELEARAEMV